MKAPFLRYIVVSDRMDDKYHVLGTPFWLETAKRIAREFEGKHPEASVSVFNHKGREVYFAV